MILSGNDKSGAMLVTSLGVYLGFVHADFFWHDGMLTTRTYRECYMVIVGAPTHMAL